MDPEGGAPDPLPMLGQLWVEVDPDPEPVLEPEPVPEELEPEEPELEPELPVLDPEPEDGVVVDELDVVVVALEPELPVVVDVVAASAANAPPTTSPVVSALIASTFRRCLCMGFLSWVRRRPLRTGTTHGAPPNWHPA